MNDNTKYVGLDVSKEKIAVAIAEEGQQKARYYGMIPNTPEAIRKLKSKFDTGGNLLVCYEAGPTGYWLYRQFLALGIECMVVAPSLIPQKPGQRVKTDRRDAIRLAELFRAGELTSVYVPTEDDEALRDLVRAREDAKEDELRAKQRLTKFFLRHNIKPPKGVKRWSYAYWQWLNQLHFERLASQITFEEYLHHLQEVQQRVERFEKEIERQSIEGTHASFIQALRTLRGVDSITATSLVSEIGSFKRFRTAKQFMAYTGLVPSESSSGETRRQGDITKTGNRHVRRLLIESSWSYRYHPAIKGKLKKRQEGQSPEVRAISWKAQTRLNGKYYRLLARGKASGKAVTAVARELAGFVWAIGQIEEL